MGGEPASSPREQSAANSELEHSTADSVLLLEKDVGLRKIIQLAKGLTILAS